MYRCREWFEILSRIQPVETFTLIDSVINMYLYELSMNHVFMYLLMYLLPN